MDASWRSRRARHRRHRGLRRRRSGLGTTAALGTLGAVASFSLQQGKHVTTGEGGLVATNDDALARRMVLFITRRGLRRPAAGPLLLALTTG